MQQHEVGTSVICPFCKKANPVASNAYAGRKHQPEAGDFTLCFGCGEFALFAGQPDRLYLRKPTEAEYLTIATAEDLTTVRRAWVQVQAELAKPKPPPPPASILDEHFGDFENMFAVRHQLPADLVERLKTMFALGCYAVFEEIGAGQRNRDLSRLKQFQHEVRSFMQNHPTVTEAATTEETET